MRFHSRRLRAAICAVLCAPSVFAAGAQTPARTVEPSRFFRYSHQQLQAHEAALKPRMNQYKQAAEQLGDFGSQTAWAAHREADGLVEIHQNWSDLMFIVSGSASLRVGGDIENPYVESPGELRSATVRGGTVQAMRSARSRRIIRVMFPCSSRRRPCVATTVMNMS